MLGLSISNVWQWHAECFSRLLLMYAYGRAPVAGPGPHTDTAATGGWRVESVGGGEVGVGLVSGSSWCGGGMSSISSDAVQHFHVGRREAGSCGQHTVILVFGCGWSSDNRR